MRYEDQAAIRALIDEHGLFAVLDTISGICGKKAEAAVGAYKADWEKAEAIVDEASSKVLDIF